LRKEKLPQNYRQMTHEEYISTDQFRAKANQCKADACHRCQVCYSDSILEAHHRTYERWGEELSSDLVALCRKCHQLFHDNGRLAKPPAYIARSKTECR
jgi:hypothetical protein